MDPLTRPKTDEKISRGTVPLKSDHNQENIYVMLEYQKVHNPLNFCCVSIIIVGN